MYSMKQILFIFCFLLTTNIVLFGQNDSISSSKLIALGLYPYNYYDTVKVDYFNHDWINCSPLSEENIGDDFSNISDLRWIKE